MTNEKTTTEQPGSSVRASAQFVPGVMHCAKCKFRLVRTNFHAADGSISAGDNKTEPCPNGCGPLWPVTWEQEAREGWARLEQMTTTPPPAPAAEQGDALAMFTEYFVRNYPGPDTVIMDPRWHASRIFRAAQYAISAATQPEARGVEGVLGRLPAPITNPEAWPPNYASGWNDCASIALDEMTAALAAAPEPVRVDDAMVERALSAPLDGYRVNSFIPLKSPDNIRRLMRAALTAALAGKDGAK